MSTSSAERWRVLGPYVDKALEMSADERASWLDSLGADNPPLAAELRGLLTRHEALKDERFLEDHPAAFGAGLPAAGFTVGAYTIESRLGEGGMGTVWLARRSDGRYEGHVAIKFLGIALVGRAEERFRREGTILARLTHPHIAHLIDAGVSPAGQPYLVLEHVDGEQVDRYCDTHHFDVHARLRLFLDVLSAVAHAHAVLVIHRDVKPSNVLVTAGGQVKLLDFGIAKLLDDEERPGAATALTRDGGAAMTLAYAAPEQITGQPVSTATDVYALGVLLYVLLTGRHPAGGDLRSTADVVRAIVDVDPRPMSAAVNGLGGDLDTIVAKALKKPPAERYQSVTAFADDVRRFLAHQPIGARPDTVRYRATKFVRRNRLAVALALAAVAATIAGVVGTVIQARTARQQRDFAFGQLSRAEAINDLNNFLLVDAAPGGKPFTVNDLLARAERIVSRQRGEDGSRSELLIAIGRQYWSQDEDGRALVVLDRAYQLSRTLTDPSTRGKAACALAAAIARGGELARAESLFREGLGELPEASQFAVDRSFCLLRGSEVSRAGGNALEGVARAQEALRVLKASPLQSEMMELRAMMDVAESYRVAGQLREATAAFEQAAAQLAALGRDDTQTAGTLYNNWALALNLLGRPLDAEKIFRRGIDVSRADRTEDAVSPMLLTNYGRVLRDIGRLPEAADYGERAYARATRAGDQTVISQALMLRATVYREQRDLSRATAMLNELEKRWSGTFPPGHVTAASLSLQRGLVDQARGDLESAAGRLAKALAIAETLAKEGLEGSSYLPTVLVRMAELELERHHPDTAVTHARRALGILASSAPPGTLTSDIGRAHLALGRGLEALGRPGDARAELAAARRHLESALGAERAAAELQGR